VNDKRTTIVDAALSASLGRPTLEAKKASKTKYTCSPCGKNVGALPERGSSALNAAAASDEAVQRRQKNRCHSSLRMVLKYVHPTTEHKQKAMRQFEEALMGANDNSCRPPAARLIEGEIFCPYFVRFLSQFAPNSTN